MHRHRRVSLRNLRHRRLWIALGVAATLLLAGGVWFWWQWQGRGPDEASVSEAVTRFRDSTAPAAPAAPLIPEAGVYTYAGEGRESLSFLGTHQEEGPTLPATVTHGADGCWTFRIEYSTYHRQTWDWCARDGRLYEHGGTTEQKFDFVAFSVDERSVFVCDPPFVAVDPDAKVGSEVRARCEGDSETTDAHVVSAGTVELVDRDPVLVAGEPVPALHYRSERVLTGDQTGTEHVDMWVSAETGLPLRNVREITVASPAPDPIHEVTYTETGRYEIVTLTPQT